MMIRKTYVKALVGGVITAIIAVIAYYLAVANIQQWLCGHAVSLLEQRLETAVSLDSVDVSIVRRQVTLYGFAIEDRQKKPMLAVDTMSVRVALMPLLRSHLTISEMRLHGINARLYKERRDTAANYQFVIDAFKKPTKADETAEGEKKHDKVTVTLCALSLHNLTLRWDIHSEPKKKVGALDSNHLFITNASLDEGGVVKTDSNTTFILHGLRCRENNSDMTLRQAEIVYEKWRKDSVSLTLNGSHCTWRDMSAHVKKLVVKQQGGSVSARVPMALQVDSLAFCRNNGKPHKRIGKPHRGYFDPGHINAVMNGSAIVRCATADSTVVDIKRLAVYDHVSGLDVRSFIANFTMQCDTMTLKGMQMHLPQSTIMAQCISGILLRNTEGKANNVQIKPFPLTARVVLRDISKPFAPVLSDFRTPLHLKVTTSGTLSRMYFRDIQVTTTDNRLSLTAQGEMRDVTKRYDLRLHFNDIRLSAHGDVKEVIVGHFAKKVRLKMGKQMRKIGDIRYRGNLTVGFKREDISGKLFTKYGNADFAFTIDGRSKMMTGNIATDSLALGSIMNIDGLGTMKASANYSFNVASKRSGKKKSKGRLPIGNMSATVAKASYKRISFSNVSAVMSSDGTTAMGEIIMPKKLFDVTLLFWYTQTDSTQNLRFKPKLTRHKKEKTWKKDLKTWNEYMKEARERAYSRNIRRKNKT